MRLRLPAPKDWFSTLQSWLATPLTALSMVSRTPWPKERRI